ncbi:MAG TPA: DUF1844 domain-containing protein [Vicinamibacteria bacterium]|jgi:hypothetical protein
MTEEKKPFTVSDRRHFTAEGETRSQAPEEAPTPPPPAPPPKVESAEKPAREAAAPPHPPDQPLPPPTPAEEAALGADAPPMDFIGLLVSLATQAGYLMSPEPGSGATPDLAGARSIIGLLEVLKQKTEGRRTPDEDRVLDGLLYELRMAFVSRARPEKA